MDERVSADSVEEAGEGRVRANTSREVNAALDREIEDRSATTRRGARRRSRGASRN
jgi:hypothetical protein